MIVIIIAGGAGSRLWPLSTPQYPKHLLKLDGSERSLLQSTYDRATKVGDEVFVISDNSHVHHVVEQLPELNTDHIMSEPDRRGTANCIIGALAQLDSKVDPETPIAFVHADHYIRDLQGFEHSFELAGRVSSEQNKLTLVGVEPDTPSTVFGYIHKGEIVDESNFVFTIESFKEKPDHETALRYLKSGDYLWNCGYFVGSIRTFERTMQESAPDLFSDYEALRSVKHSAEKFADTYLGLSEKVIDIALIEKAKDLLVVPASFDWMDVGSYSDMHRAVESDESGNHLYGAVTAEELTNSFVQNYENKPLAVVGLDNIVVINTPSGILVARKDIAKTIGEISKRIEGDKS